MSGKLIYAGWLTSGETSFYRYVALKRLLGDKVVPFNLRDLENNNRKLRSLLTLFPKEPLINNFNSELIRLVNKEKPSFVWFDRPIYFTPKTMRFLKANGVFTICYNQENPLGPRKDGCWHQFFRVFEMFDLHCLFRSVDLPRYEARNLAFIETQLSFAPEQHFLPSPDWSDKDRTREVSYIGSPYEDRPKFLQTLGERYQVPLKISGSNWRKFLDERIYAKYVTGGHLADSEYREGIWKSKINLAFVTHLNEEDVAHKSFEIAACGGFLLALRTARHQACFEEGKEAEFFSSIRECAEKIKYYLAHPEQRQEIARRGHERALASGYDNDTQLARILAKANEIRENSKV